jgi:diguanylate cyclase (GGDEF)-like protein/PAS domain S-box-containing protein
MGGQKDQSSSLRGETSAYGPSSIDPLGHIVWDWDLATNTIRWSEEGSAVTAFGVPEGPLLLSWWEERVHPEDIERVLDKVGAAIAAGERFSDGYRLRRADGSWAQVYAQAVVIRGSDGEAVRMVGSLQDHSDRYEAIGALRERESQLATIFGQAMIGILHVAPDGRALMVNGRMCEILGRSAKQVRAENFRDWTHPDDLERDTLLFETKMAAAEAFMVEKRYVRPDGTIVWCSVHVSFVGSAGAVTGIIVVAEDITARREAETELARQKSLLQNIVDSVSDLIFVKAADGRFILTNRALDESCGPLTGLRTPEVFGDELGCGYETVDAEVIASGEPREVEEIIPVKGHPRLFETVKVPWIKDGATVGVIGVSRDVTLSRQTAEKLRWTSEHDGLTELPNRETFQTRLQGATIRAMESGDMVGLLLMDLDHFKHVNDTLGHAAGDRLLTIFAKRLKACVGPGDFVARLGGDEFAVILEGVKEEEELVRAGQSILERLQAPISIDGRAASTGASIGGALFPRDAATAQELFNNADMALFSLKAAGRGGTKMFHNHMRQQAQNVASQLSLARVALSEESVIPNYQPKIDLRTGEVAGFEALLRWRHPRFGIQLPETVAEAFKDYELASRIGDIMQKKVVRDLRRWEERGFIAGPVSINAAPSEFLRDDYAERLLKIITDAGVAPGALEVEVTEHVFFDRASEFVARALKALHEAGVRIALDDFGTGYSSLSHLRDFPVDVVKIDHSFISKMIEEPEIGAIVSAVIDLARSLRIDVVAEGVETEEQRDALAQKGCSFGQGYLFGRAAEADEVQLLLRRVQAAA